MASPANSGKSMSSRLLTMKFMQRAAASAPSSTSNSPLKKPNTQPSKRQRYSTDAPSSDQTTSDLEAVRAALAAEELKRVQAVERQAIESGETRWVLSFQDPSAGRGIAETPGVLRTITGGYADLDVSDEEPTGRLNFGKRKPGAPEEKDSPESSEDEAQEEEDEEEGDQDENDPVASLLREERRKAAEQAREKLKERKRKREKTFNELGDKRRKKEVKLNGNSKLDNINVNGEEFQGVRMAKGGLSKSVGGDMECHACKQKVHIAAHCPNKKTQRWSKETKSWDRGR